MRKDKKYKKEDKKKKKRIRNYLPYIGSFIIFLGVTRLIIFYSAFDISIIDFLEFSEILTSFLDIILLSVILICFSIIKTNMTEDKKEQKVTQQAFDKLCSEESSIKRLWLYIKLLHELLIGGFFLILMFYIWHFINNDITINTIVWAAGFFVLIFAILVIRFELIRKHKQLKSSRTKRQFSEIILLTLLFIGIVFTIAKAQISSIKDDKSTIGTTITFDNDELLISDSLNYYIGKTQNYVFIHHEIDRTTEVIPISRVKRILIKKKKVDGFKLYD